MHILKDTNIRRALAVRARTRDWVLNPYRFGAANLDPFFDDTELYLPLNTAHQFNDLSPIPATQTITGTGISISTAVNDCFGGSGGSALFETAVTRGLTSSRSMALGTGPVCIEYFFRPVTGDRGLVLGVQEGGVQISNWARATNTQSTWSGVVGPGSANNTLPANQWRHVMIQRFLNGVWANWIGGILDPDLKLLTSFSDLTSVKKYVMGAVAQSGGNFLSTDRLFGNVNHLRISKAERAPQQGQNFAPPTSVEEFLIGPVWSLSSTVQWNPAAKAPGLTLSESNLRLTTPESSGNGNTLIMNAYATHSHPAATTTGRYFEVLRVQGTIAPVDCAGVGQWASTPLHVTRLGVSANSWGYLSDTGNKYNAAVSTAYGSSWAINDVIGVYLKNGKLWFSKNGVWQGGGDPVAETGEAFSGLTGDIFPIHSISNVAAQFYSHRGRFAAGSFSYPVPSGGLPWQN